MQFFNDDYGDQDDDANDKVSTRLDSEVGVFCLYWQKKYERHGVEGGHHEEEEAGGDLDGFRVDGVEDEWAEHHTQDVDTRARSEQRAYSTAYNNSNCTVRPECSNKLVSAVADGPRDAVGAMSDEILSSSS